MTTTVTEQVRTVVAAANLTAADCKYKALSIGGTITNTPKVAAGLLKTSVKSGDHAGVIYAGETKAWAAAAVTSVGWPLTVTTSGWVTNAVSGDNTSGRFLETCNSGDLVRVMAAFDQLGYFVA